jgi:hypothetical protein
MFVDVPLNQLFHGRGVARGCPHIHGIFAAIDIALQAFGFIPGCRH